MLTREEYEEFIYTIRERYPSIETSTLIVIMIASHVIPFRVSARFFAAGRRLSLAVDFNPRKVARWPHVASATVEFRRR